MFISTQSRATNFTSLQFNLYHYFSCLWKILTKSSGIQTYLWKIFWSSKTAIDAHLQTRLGSAIIHNGPLSLTWGSGRNSTWRKKIRASEGIGVVSGGFVGGDGGGGGGGGGFLTTSGRRAPVDGRSPVSKACKRVYNNTKPPTQGGWAPGQLTTHTMYAQTAASPYIKYAYSIRMLPRWVFWLHGQTFANWINVHQYSVTFLSLYQSFIIFFLIKCICKSKTHWNVEYALHFSKILKILFSCCQLSVSLIHGFCLSGTPCLTQLYIVGLKCRHALSLYTFLCYKIF